MNKILKLAKKYYKQSHLSLFPFRDSNKILDNLNFLYDEKKIKILIHMKY